MCTDNGESLPGTGGDSLFSQVQCKVNEKMNEERKEQR